MKSAEIGISNIKKINDVSLLVVGLILVTVMINKILIIFTCYLSGKIYIFLYVYLFRIVWRMNCMKYNIPI